jgi:uncharacterized protein (TIGR03437 family)
MRNLRAALILAAAVWPVTAQVWDNTGNHLLSGTYYFREVTFTSAEASVVYGTIDFSGGSYSINAQQLEGTEESEGLGAFSASGNYSISASGFGFISGPVIDSPIYGLVGANGVFIGSTTETNATDFFVAAPLNNQSAGTLQGSYSISYTDPTGSLSENVPLGALVQMSSSGGGGIGNVNLTAYLDSSSPVTQTISGVNYTVSSNAYVVNFPNSNTALLQGQWYMYSTPDGSFVFGGSPQNFDMLVGVRNGSETFGGLYYTAGFITDDSQVVNTGNAPTYTSYGSFNAKNGVILAHQRVEDGGGDPYGLTFATNYPGGSGGSFTDNSRNIQFFGGTDGTQVGVGLGPYPGISVSLRAPSVPASGVFLSPQGIVNTASYSPFTAGVSRGDFIILEGLNLGPSTIQYADVVPFPTVLGSVKVLINNIAAPICYASATQIAVIVPNEIPEGPGSVAQFQVINGLNSSNVVTEYVNETTPGIFTQEENGSGYAAALHPDGSLVTPSNPANIGEIVAVFMSGLGDVFPSLLDGAAAPTSPHSTTANAITADISGTAATVTFSGLAPGFVGLYQVNLQIPDGVSAGDNVLGITGPDSYNSEALISIGGAGSITSPAPHVRAMRPHPYMHRPFVHRSVSATVTQ